MTKQRTRCPKCSTAFYITDAQLQQANGYVRCGSCLEVFEASLYLEQVKPKAPRTAAPVKKPVSTASASQASSHARAKTNTTTKPVQAKARATSSKATTAQTSNTQKDLSPKSASTTTPKQSQSVTKLDAHQKPDTQPKISAAPKHAATSLSQAAQAAHQGVNQAIRNKTNSSTQANQTDQIKSAAPQPPEPKQAKTETSSSAAQSKSGVEVTAEDQWISDLIAELESNKAETENNNAVEQEQAEIERSEETNGQATPKTAPTDSSEAQDATTSAQKPAESQAQPEPPVQQQTSTPEAQTPTQQTPTQTSPTAIQQALIKETSNTATTQAKETEPDSTLAQNKTPTQVQPSAEHTSEASDQPAQNSDAVTTNKADAVTSITDKAIVQSSTQRTSAQTKTDQNNKEDASSQPDSRAVNIDEQTNLQEALHEAHQNTEQKIEHEIAPKAIQESSEKSIAKKVVADQTEPKEAAVEAAAQTQAVGVTDEINNEPAVPSFLVEKKRSKGVLWFAFSAVAAGVLFAQYLFWNFEKAAYSQTLRPLLVHSCKQLHCIVPVYENLAQLRAEQLIIRPVPNNQGQVQIDALIVNKAAIEQRFPTLRIQFKDNMGKTVNQIDIAPEQYLTGDLSQLSAMPAQTPIHIQLNVAHEAPLLGYQLQFISS